MSSPNSSPDDLKRNHRLVELAYDCLFINAYEKEETLKCIMEGGEDDSTPFDATEIFRRENLISEENIEFLVNFDEHLETRRQDRLFGRIAVANGFSDVEKVDKALAYQKDYFTKTGISVTLGDLLVDEKILTREERASILLTQNRLKGDALLDAFNDLGKNLEQKDAVNKRFGVLAIKNNLATRDQVNEALEIQRDEMEKTGQSRFVGRILKKTASLSNTDIEQVIAQQKQFEKRRLDLEKALYTVQSELKVLKKFNRLFEYTIEKGGTQAFVKKKRRAVDESISVYEFLIWLRRIGIRFGVENDAVLENFIKDDDLLELPVAKGYPAEPCVDESIEFFFETGLTVEGKTGTDDQTDAVCSSSFENDASEPGSKKGSTDGQEEDQVACLEEPPKKEASIEAPTEENKEGEPEDEGTSEQETTPENMPLEIQDVLDEWTSDIKKQDEETKKTSDMTPDTANGLVKKGDVLARIIPGVPGIPGRDVLGHPIHPAAPRACYLNTGNGVRRKNDVFFAQFGGRPVLKHGTTLLVCPPEKVLDIKIFKKDISEKIQDKYRDRDIEVRGNINPDGRLCCRSLKVTGDVAGQAFCSTSIEVKGKIEGRGNALPDENETADEINILCMGNVRVQKAIAYAKIQTAGELSAFNSKIVSSEILAFKGITAKDVLSESSAPSVLRFGLEPGDKIIAADRTLEMKYGALAKLKKEDEKIHLKEKYEQDLKAEREHQDRQAILLNLAEILQAPELDQIEGLEAKIEHLNRLPEFSSIRSYYLKLPVAGSGVEAVQQILKSVRKMEIEEAVSHIQSQIDPEPEQENAVSNMQRIEMEYKAQCSDLEHEVLNQSESIQKLETEIRHLEALREKLASVHVNSLSRSKASVQIRNMCQKGTVVKGRASHLVLEKTVYHVRFKEKVDPKTQSAYIETEAY